MYGWRARIGAVFGPAVAETSVVEFYRMAPEGVTLVLTNLGLRYLTTQDLAATFQALDRAIDDLAQRKPDVIVIGGAPVLREAAHGQDEALASAAEARTGIPTMTSQMAAMAALREVGARRIVLGSPHGARQTDLLVQLLEARGFEVLATGALDLPLDQFPTLPAHTAYRLFADLVRRAPSAEAAYLPSPSTPCPHIAQIEQDLGIPLVTQNAALLWAALHRLRLRLRIVGHGRLLASLAP